MMECSSNIPGNHEEILTCNICGKELDPITSAVTQDPADSIYVCFGALKQKIFVYGKYHEGRYGAAVIISEYTKHDCDDKVCEKDIRDFLKKRGETEYSRFNSCRKGKMECIILTNEMVKNRKRDLKEGLLESHLPLYENKRKYFCHKDSEKLNFKCGCGEELVQLSSERHRELIGMEDTLFMQRFLSGILEEK